MGTGDLKEARDALSAVLRTGGYSSAWEPDEEKFRSLRERVRQAVAVTAQPSTSVAVIDRTALWRTTQLLAGERGSSDPFIALADLATILGAAIFDDRIVVLGNEEIIDITTSANELLGLDDVIRPILSNPDEKGVDPDAYTLSLLAEQLVASAVQELEHASEQDANWIGLLRGKWKELLPGLSDFPAYRGLLTTAEKYKQYDTYDLFNIVGGEWKFSFEDPAELILDNDLRGLFYERLVQALSVMLTQASGGPAVHYAGGCLRAPMLLTRAELVRTASREPTAPSGWLQQRWTVLESAGILGSGGVNPIVLPFWADAVISQVERPEDFKSVVKRYRAKAEGFRKRRGKIDLAMQQGNLNELRRLIAALRGDVPALPSDIAEIAGRAGDTALTIADSSFSGIPGVAGAAAKLLLPPYLFRPHLRLLMRLGKNARSLTRPLSRTLTIFKYAEVRDTDPSNFLEQLGRVAWLT
jgi:hypothetical protein